MHPFVRFLMDNIVLVYLVIKSLVYALIPSSLVSKGLEGEIVLVTGGSGGVGQPLALKLAALGCHVVIWDIDDKGGQRTVKLIRDKEGIAYFYLCDVSKRKDVYSTASKVKTEVGHVSILINNAAIVCARPLLTVPDEMIEKTFQVNAMSHFWMCKAFLPDMITKNHGHVVTVASIAGYVPLYNSTDYCASKSAAISFHECLSLELQKNDCTGIKTTVILPYHIKTDMFKGFKARLFQSVEPEYVADKIISAIRRNDETAFIPGLFSFLVMLKSMFPLPAALKGIEISLGTNVMDNDGPDDARRKQFNQ